MREKGHQRENELTDILIRFSELVGHAYSGR